LLQAKRETHECDVASAFLFCFSFAPLQVKLLIRLKGNDSTRNKRRSPLLQNKRSNQEKRGLYLVLKKTIYMYTRVIIVIIKLLMLFRYQCQCSFLICVSSCCSISNCEKWTLRRIV
jgi:hypothetical protein